MCSQTVALALALIVSPGPQPTPQQLPTITVAAPRAMLTLQIARTPAQQEAGLMWVTALAPHAGMLFVFPSDQPLSFWMKNTLIPLDMVFVGADGRVRKVFADVPVVDSALADDRIPLEIASGRYVIELPAGEAAADGIVSGTPLRIGAFLTGDARTS
ncbi:MAG TPA: DUF192 domain-containing protein [Candidatus Baltobacteraceae bacterium]